MVVKFLQLVPAAKLLSLGPHAQRGLQYLVCVSVCLCVCVFVCVCVCVCVCVLLNISLFM